MVDRQASEWREVCYTRSTICGMAAAEAVAVAVITTGGECVSLEVQTARAAVCQGRAGQGRAGQGKECDRKSAQLPRGEREHTERACARHEARRFATPTAIIGC